MAGVTPFYGMPPGSGSAWTDADPDTDPGGTSKKPRKCSGSLGEYRTGNIKARNTLCLLIFNGVLLF